MHGLSPDTDLSPLSGCMLTFVGFGQHQVQLAFAGAPDCHISIEGEYAITPSGGEVAIFRGAADGASALLPLLGHSVVLAKVPIDGTVRMDFDDGAVVEVRDSEAHYESYQLNLGDRLLIV